MDLSVYELEHITCSIVEELRAAGLEMAERHVLRLGLTIARKEGFTEFSLIEMKNKGNHKIDKIILFLPYLPDGSCCISGPEYYVKVLDWSLDRIDWLSDRINRRIQHFIDQQKRHKS